MNLLDIIFIIPLLYFLVKGFQKGLIIEVFSVIAFIMAVVGAMKLSNNLLLRSGVELGSKWLPYVSFIIVFLAIFILILFLARLLEKIIKTAQLNIFNRIAGSVFGAFKVVLLFSMLMWATDQVDVIPEQVKEKSISYRYIKPISPVIISFIADNKENAKGMIMQIEDFFDQVGTSI